MSDRLGRALAASLRLRTQSGEYALFLVEGVTSSVAEGLSKAWDDASMPQLAVVSAAPGKFGRHALVDASGTQLRNQAGTRGVVLVLCDGEQVPDRQSLGMFESLPPSALLETSGDLALLAQQEPAAEMDGPAGAVRRAIVEMGSASRPSATAVADYLDLLAAGADPLRELPVIGGFTDHADPGERVDSSRVVSNLALAADRTSDDVLRPAAYADLRKRAERVFLSRPGTSPTAAAAAAAAVMTDLQAGSPDLLRALSFDEARELFERRPEGLSETVRRELTAFRNSAPRGSQVEGLPWDSYLARAAELTRGGGQREAAGELCALDDAHQRRVFTRETRRKLEQSLRDKSVNGSNPSCPEAAIARAAEQLGGFVHRVQLLEPHPPAARSVAATNRSGAGRILTLACARLRLGGLLQEWADAEEEIDGLLVRAADDDDLGGQEGLQAAVADLNLDAGGTLPALKLRLHANDRARTTVQVDWRPDLDDVALLRAALLFADQPSLTLTADSEPTLHAFCGAQPVGFAAVPHTLRPLAALLHDTANDALENGLSPALLTRWAEAWTSAAQALQAAGNEADAEALALAGAVRAGQCAALTGFAPMKAEWLGQQLEALWKLLDRAEDGRDTEPGDAAAAAAAVARTTAAHHPAHIRLRNQDNVLLPTAEGRIWSLYGSRQSLDESGAASDSLHAVITQLLTLQPEAAGHLRCLAWGPGAADLLAAEAVELIGTRIGSAVVERVEIFCVGDQPGDKPSRPTLDQADRKLRGEQDALQLRYMPDLAGARRVLAPARDTPAVHLALVTGLTEGGRRLQVDAPEVELPRLDAEVLFAPRVWQRPGKERRTLLMPPAASPTGRSWLQLQNAVSDSWPEPDGPLEVPEVRTGTLNIRDQLVDIHELALWVATLDRYATRDSLEQALGRDQVAILHQERRLGGESPLALVLSQKSGGPADRAIGRSLRIAGIVDNPDVALEIGTDLRKVASQGYGILALQAATSGAGINELVGHVVAFSMLATTATPWPLPPGCRVLLVSLDEYRHWFNGKRADLLAIALDPAERGVHVAVIEVKARRSSEADAKAGALDQLVQTIAATRWAAYPDSSVQSRLWLNRIAEAAYSVARESKFRLDAAELDALENFRLGDGSLEWAGVGLVFRPNAESDDATHQQSVAGDIVPVVLRSVTLTEELLRTATSTDLTQLRTVESERAPFQSTRVRRRPEAGTGSDAPAAVGPETSATPQASEDGPKSVRPDQENREDTQPPPEETSEPAQESPAAGSRTGEPDTSPNSEESPDDGSGQDLPDGPATPATTAEPAAAATSAGFRAPVLGWDADTGDAVSWHPAGPPSPNLLQNGHVEIWGSSGMGKTQFVMSLLAQLTHHSGSKVGILDFKNDYSGDTGFPDFANAEFLDLWDGGAPYNPLALPSDSKRDIDAAVIEIRDTVEEATRAFTRMGVRQKSKLKTALENAYRIGRQEHRWPTLKTLGGQLDDDLTGVIGDLTEYDLFGSGEPLGTVIDRNVVFGLSRIPGNGQTTVFAAGFILSSLLLTVQNLPPVPNTIRYVAVVDEAHRVAAFKAIGTMIREGRSKGLSVVLATQQPLDLPDIVAANAQTKICFGLPDGPAATMAARKLDPHNARLPEQIRTLGVGEAYVSLRGGTPQLVRMAQAHRDAPALGLPPLRHPQ